MNRIIIISLCIITWSQSISQNLIYDFSFENSYDKSKSFSEDITQFDGWKVIDGAPFVNPYDLDLILTKDSTIIGKGVVFCVIAVLGIIENNIFKFNSDILAAELMQKTKKNNKYICGFDLKIPTTYTDININKFGIRLIKSSNRNIKISKNNSFILDSITSNYNWKRYEMSILVDDEYDNLEIGVFANPKEVNYIQIDPDELELRKIYGTNNYNVRFHIDNVTLKKID